MLADRQFRPGFECVRINEHSAIHDFRLPEHAAAHPKGRADQQYNPDRLSNARGLCLRQQQQRHRRVEEKAGKYRSFGTNNRNQEETGEKRAGNRAHRIEGINIADTPAQNRDFAGIQLAGDRESRAHAQCCKHHQGGRQDELDRQYRGKGIVEGANQRNQQIRRGKIADQENNPAHGDAKLQQT